MIQKVNIKNFKSVLDLEMELGRVNVFIGENGCGKSNILEAIAFGGAAAADKLNYEYMYPRGIRFVDPAFMFSAFNEYGVWTETGEYKKIVLIFTIDGKQINYPITRTQSIFFPPSAEFTWGDEELENAALKLDQVEENMYDHETGELFSLSQDEKELYAKLVHTHRQLQLSKKNKQLTDFLIYSPENTSLRIFEGEEQIKPLGIRGQGLFSHLKELSIRQPEKLEEITDCLHFLDWFEDVDWDISSDVFNERKIKIKDRYLHPNHNFFDQRSANEGFLFCCFT